MSSLNNILAMLKSVDTADLFKISNAIRELLESRSTMPELSEIVSNTVTKESIDVFHDISKKGENDEYNKLREDIICGIINNTFPIEWFEDIKWINLKTGIDAYIKTYICSIPIKSINAKKFAGRKNSKDFLLTITHTNNTVETVNLEFKYNAKSINGLPEFLQVASKFFIKNQPLDYASIFYDKYLPQIIELYKNELAIDDLEMPDKIRYLKDIYHTDKNPTNHNMFKLMLQSCKNKTLVAKKKVIVDKSINEYLSLLELDIDAVNAKFAESQTNKKFMLYKNGTFYYDTMTLDELKITGVDRLKAGKGGENNTIVCSTNNKNSYIHMLLRWKNYAGILFPAWQISLVRT